MTTMVADLLPRVERSQLWFSENVELLFCAEIAPSCHWSEGSPPVCLHILHVLHILCEQESSEDYRITKAVVKFFRKSHLSAR